MTFCPDCETDIPAEDFVPHRETDHPPTPKTLSVAGVLSGERFGYAPPDPED
jgi:hypothetical protein